MPTPVKIQGEFAEMDLTPVGGALTPTISLTDWEINRAITSEEVTDNSSGGDKEFLPGMRGWTATAKLVYVDAEPSQEGLEAMCGPGADFSGGLPLFTFYPRKFAAASGYEKWSGKGFITSWKLAGSNGKAFATDITIQGSGPLARAAL